VTALDLQAYVGAPDSDIDYVTDCFNEAHALVDKFVGTATVPLTIMNRAKLECGSELFHRRSAPNGISQFASIDGSAIRISRDPMIGARKVLEPWLPIGVA
jgi:hypothetical protein